LNKELSDDKRGDLSLSRFESTVETVLITETVREGHLLKDAKTSGSRIELELDLDAVRAIEEKALIGRTMEMTSSTR
jgi:hypothetical protein